MPTPLSDTNVDTAQRVFAYARVSTVEQLTENQRDQIARAGYAITPKRFIEEQISGNAPVFSDCWSVWTKGIPWS
jgi:putative DNA-invertase from lambdoid prophage Rac